MKCAVFACQNTKADGRFIGDFCAACDTTIRTGKAGPGTSFINIQAVEVAQLRAENVRLRAVAKLNHDTVKASQREHHQAMNLAAAEAAHRAAHPDEPYGTY
jgi:hypothetical protein